MIQPTALVPPLAPSVLALTPPGVGDGAVFALPDPVALDLSAPGQAPAAPGNVLPPAASVVTNAILPAVAVVALAQPKGDLAAPLRPLPLDAGVTELLLAMPEVEAPEPVQAPPAVPTPPQPTLAKTGASPSSRATAQAPVPSRRKAAVEDVPDGTIAPDVAPLPDVTVLGPPPLQVTTGAPSRPDARQSESSAEVAPHPEEGNPPATTASAEPVATKTAGQDSGAGALVSPRRGDAPAPDHVESSPVPESTRRQPDASAPVGPPPRPSRVPDRDTLSGDASTAIDTSSDLPQDEDVGSATAATPSAVEPMPLVSPAPSMPDRVPAPSPEPPAEPLSPTAADPGRIAGTPAAPVSRTIGTAIAQDRLATTAAVPTETTSVAAQPMASLAPDAGVEPSAYLPADTPFPSVSSELRSVASHAAPVDGAEPSLAPAGDGVASAIVPPPTGRVAAAAPGIDAPSPVGSTNATIGAPRRIDGPARRSSTSDTPVAIPSQRASITTAISAPAAAMPSGERPSQPTTPASASAPVVAPAAAQTNAAPIVPASAAAPATPASIAPEALAPAPATAAPEVPSARPASIEPARAAPPQPLRIALPATEAPPLIAGASAPAFRLFAAAIHAARIDEREGAPAAPLAQPAPATPLHAAPAVTDASNSTLDMGDHRWPHAMVERIESLREAASAAKDAASTSIRLVPDALGAIDVKVRTEGDTVHVHFTAEQAATRALIADAQPRLAEIAEARGLKLAQGDVGAGGQQQRQPASQPAPTSAAPRAAPRDEAPDSTTTTRIA